MYDYEYYTCLMQVNACEEFLSPVNKELTGPWLKELQELTQVLEWFLQNHERIPENERGDKIIWWMLNTYWSTNPDRYQKLIEAASLPDWEKEWLIKMYTLSYEVTYLHNTNMDEFRSITTGYKNVKDENEFREMQKQTEVLIERDQDIERLHEFIIFTIQDLKDGELDEEARDFFSYTYIKEKEQLEIEVFGELCLHESV